MIVYGPIYLVSYVKHSGFPRTSSSRNLMSAVTHCEWLSEVGIPYKLSWVDKNNVRHDGCEAITDKLDEIAKQERHLREAGEQS